MNLRTNDWTEYILFAIIIFRISHVISSYWVPKNPADAVHLWHQPVQRLDMLRSVLSECCGLTLMKLLVVALFENMLIMTPVSPSVSSYCSCVFPGVYNVNAGFVPAHFCLQLGIWFLAKARGGFAFCHCLELRSEKVPITSAGEQVNT